MTAYYAMFAGFIIGTAGSVFASDHGWALWTAALDLSVVFVVALLWAFLEELR